MQRGDLAGIGTPGIIDDAPPGCCFGTDLHTIFCASYQTVQLPEVMQDDGGARLQADDPSWYEIQGHKFNSANSDSKLVHCGRRKKKVQASRQERTSLYNGGRCIHHSCSTTFRIRAMPEK